MKISYNWLKQYINIDIEPKKLSSILTDCGLEVTGFKKYESVKGGLQGIVIGEVKTKEKHPNADKLSIATVDIGEENLLHIVCGASNLNAGQKVPVATIGTTLYYKDKSFKIKKSNLRGEISEGMICAEDELGLGNSHDGIMVLNKTAKSGTPAKEYFNIKEDTVFDIDLTPNRTDAISHFGVARDIFAVINCLKLTENLYQNDNVKLNKPCVENFKITPSKQTNKIIDIIIDDKKACPRYSGLTISDIKVKESPLWLKNFLNAVEMRPVNNIVDITNFVMLETGQPLHAFDADKIKGNKVIVKKLYDGYKFTTLDGIQRELSKNDLMICNEKEPMCIAGVFGGEKYGVTYETKNIFLESACFNSARIRKTSKAHNLQTEASFRFERGTDPNITVYVLKRAGMLIKEIAKGNICSNIIDVYPRPVENQKINVSYLNVDKLIGKSIERNIIKNIVKSLEMTVISENNDGLLLSVPCFKADVLREVDVIEEILRIYGYNNIEIPSELKMSLTYSLKPDKEKIQNIISDFLTNNGFNEIINNSLTKSEYYGENKTYNIKNNVKLLNPLSKDLNVMRQTLLFGGLEAIRYNQNRKNFDLKLYEFGNTYLFNQEKKSENNILSQYSEAQHLALFICGRKQSKTWNTNDDDVDFYYLKLFVNNILKRCGLNISKLDVKNNNLKIFEQVLTYFSLKSKLVEFGSVNKTILNQFDIKQNIYYAEFNWDLVIKLLKHNEIKYQEVTKFPEVKRDLALLIDENIKFENIKNLAFQTEKYLLKKVNLFDIYKDDSSKQIEKGKKSYAVSFTFQDTKKTLTDKIINKIMDKLINSFKNNINAIIR